MGEFLNISLSQLIVQRSRDDNKHTLAELGSKFNELTNVRLKFKQVLDQGENLFQHLSTLTVIIQGCLKVPNGVPGSGFVITSLELILPSDERSMVNPL